MIKKITIGTDVLKDNGCATREVRVLDKTFKIWTTKDCFESIFNLTEKEILEQINKAVSLEFTKLNSGLFKDILIIETETHKLVVISKQ